MSSLEGGDFRSIPEEHFNDTIMVKVVEPDSPLDGMIFNAKAITHEYHEDTNSTTVWIEVVEY
jgi:hypothetical protein